MGQKVHPVGFRLGVIKTWNSKWYANKKNYAEFLHEDIEIRKYLKKKLFNAGISKVDIERTANKAKIDIYTARPGIVIGKKGTEIDALKEVANIGAGHAATALSQLTKRRIMIDVPNVQICTLEEAASVVGNGGVVAYYLRSNHD